MRSSRWRSTYNLDSVVSCTSIKDTISRPTPITQLLDPASPSRVRFSLRTVSALFRRSTHLCSPLPQLDTPCLCEIDSPPSAVRDFKPIKRSLILIRETPYGDVGLDPFCATQISNSLSSVDIKYPHLYPHSCPKVQSPSARPSSEATVRRPYHFSWPASAQSGPEST